MAKKRTKKDQVEKLLPPNRIAEARAAKGWNQQELAAALGTTQQSISRYETSQRDFSVSVLLRLCGALDVSASYLLCMGDDDDQPAAFDVPVFGAIAAGTPIDMESADDTHPVPALVRNRYPAAFLLRVEGESMNRILPNGCLALVEPCTAIDYDGEPYAVSVDERAATIKRAYLTATGFRLVPDSDDPTFQMQVFERDGSDADHSISVIGRVVWHCIPCDWSY